MPGHFEKKYGEGKFEMVQVEDMEKEGCFDPAVQGKCAKAVLTCVKTRLEEELLCE